MLVACLAAPYGARHPTASQRGVVSFGFESSGFCACGATECAAATRDDPMLAPAVDLYDFRCNGVYVEFDGGLSPPGEYGHLGQLRHEIRVRKLHYASCDLPADCR